MSFHVPEKLREQKVPVFMRTTQADGNNGVFTIGHGTLIFTCIVSDGMNWEHVSVRSHGRRLPTWEEMCFIKDMFWDKEDVVMQLHPPKSEYVNCHPDVLHLWRPIGITIPRPPTIMIGPK